MNLQGKMKLLVPSFINQSPIALALWRLFKDPYFDPITQSISRALPKWQRQTIVQIGTNDGERDDPVSALLLNRRRWRALLVEPLPVYFEKLVKHYGSSPRFMFERSAVGTDTGRFPIYHMDESARESPNWRDYFDRIGSLNRSELILNLGDCAEAMDRYIVATEIEVLTMSALLNKWQITDIDALILDAEGYDWKILKQTLELGIRPKVIVFEHTHLEQSHKDEALKAIEGDYIMESFERDHVCIRTH